MSFLADAILVFHFLWVLAVLVPIPLIWIGGRLRWEWIRGFAWRTIHLAMIALVALESVLGIVCPLTVWESALRLEAHEAPYSRSFIEFWIGRILFYDFPPWVFIAAYCAVCALVLFLYFKYPPRRSPSKASPPSKPEAGDRSRP